MTAPAFPPTSSWRPREASRPSPMNPASTAPSAFAGRATNPSARPPPPSPTTRATPRPGRRRSTPPHVGGAAIIPTRSACWPERGFASCGAAGKTTVPTTSCFTVPPSARPPHDNSRVDTGCLTGPPGSRQAGDAVDLEHAPVGRVVEVARPDQRHRGAVSAEVLAVHPADRLAVLLVEVGVEHVDRELDHVGELAARCGDDRAEALAHLAELGDQGARADDPPLLVLRDLTRDEQEPPAARLGAVGVADGSRERRRGVELDPLRHGLLPSRTIVSPLVAASSSRVETAAATSAGSMSRPPGLIRAMARTASSNDLPVFAAMLRAAVHTRSVPV